MYCSSCGGAVARGLSYCNKCGAKLSANESVEKAPGLKPDFLVFSIMATFIFGTAVITMLMGVMRVILGLPVEAVLGFHNPLPADAHTGSCVHPFVAA